MIDTKHFEEAKNEIDAWTSEMLKKARSELTRTNQTVSLIKERIRMLYDDIISRQREIEKAKDNIRWNVGIIAELESQVSMLEELHKDFGPSETQKLLLRIHEELEKENNSAEAQRG